MTDTTLENRISEANEDELATIIVAATTRLGELGLSGREATIERFKSKEVNPRQFDVDLEEGLSQLGDVLTALQPETTE